MPTGFADLDAKLAGMQDSNLLILAARPGLGKTSLVLNIAQHLAVEHKMPVGIFSLEMSKEELVDRLLVAQGEIDSWRLKTGRLKDEDWTRVQEAMGQLADAPLFIDDTPGINILEIRTKARKLQGRYMGVMRGLTGVRAPRATPCRLFRSTSRSRWGRLAPQHFRSRRQTIHITGNRPMGRETSFARCRWVARTRFR